MDAKEYSYSTDQEYYRGQHDSVEAAIAAAMDEVEADLEIGETHTVWVGEVDRVTVESLIDTDSIVERMAESAGDEVGEAAEDWLMSVSREHHAELKTLIADWVRRVEPPTFWRVDNIVEHRVTKEA